MTKKDAMKAFKAHKKKANSYSKFNDCEETFVDGIVDLLAHALDMAYKCDDFMTEWCK